jgi:uncharacterized membrane protein
MLSFLKIIRRSLELCAALVLVDGIAAFLLNFLNYAFLESIGDLMLVEVALLFILAGLMDFASSIGGTQFRKLILSSKEDYSPSKHKETERRASVFFLAGAILLLILIATAVYESH